MAQAHHAPLSRTASSSNFSILWNQAIDLYIERTGEDLRKPNSWSASLQTLALCQTSTEAEPFFKKMMDGLRPSQKVSSKWRSLREKLDTLVDVVLIFNDAAADLAAALGTPGGKTILVALGIVLKAVRGKTERSEQLEKILDKLLYFWKRFKLREKIRAYLFDEELFASIFVALLNTMGLATAIVSGGWISNAWKAILGNKDINDVIVQIDLLVEAELRADIVQLLVHHNEGVIGQADRDTVIQEQLRHQKDRLDEVDRNVKAEICAVAAASVERDADIHADVKRGNEETAAFMIAMENRLISRIDSMANTDPLNSLVLNKQVIVIQMPDFSLSTILTTAGRTLRDISLRLPDGTEASNRLVLAVVTVFAVPAVTGHLFVSILNAAMFLWYICGIPRPPSRINVVVLDVEKDKVIVLTLDDCESWEGFHSNLVEHFKDSEKVGHAFVQKGRYEIEDSEHNVVTQQDWRPEPGMVLGITVILRLEQRSSIMCPYCENIMEYNKIASEHPLTCTQQQCNLSFLVSDSDSYANKHPVVSSPFRFEVPAASQAEHAASSSVSGAFRKVRLVLPSEQEVAARKFVDSQHPNYIDGVWHCSNCGCPDSIAVGRRMGPLGGKSQCGTCGKFWHRHRRPRPAEYNSNPDFHLGLKNREYHE